MSAARGPPPRAGPGRVVLWDAARPRLVARSAAEALWREGKVSGLFNLQTKAQFDACEDFCVEAAAGSRHAAQSEAAEVQGLRTRLADAQAANLVLEEQLRAAQRRAQRERRDEHGELVRVRQECAALRERNEALQTQLRSAEKRVAQQKAEIATLRKGDKAKKEKPRKQQQRDCAECAALRAQVEEANALTEELRGDLKSERETVRELTLERMQLERRVAALEQCIRSADEHVPRTLRLGAWAPAQAPLAPGMPLAPQLGAGALACPPPVYAPLGAAPLLGCGTLVSGTAPAPPVASCGENNDDGDDDEEPFDEEQTRETERLLRTLLLSQPVSPDES